MKKLAVFDLDGTLHHTELALAPAIAMAAAEITGGEEPSYELVNTLYGEPLEKFCAVLVGSEEPAVYSRFIELVQAHQARTLPSYGKLYPGVKEMLQELHTMGFNLAVLSNAHIKYMKLVTETLGIKHYFSRLVGRTGEGSKTARLKELSSGYDFTVMIGDRYHDVMAGLENSFPVIACSYGYGKAQEHTGAVAVDQVEDIVPRIRQLVTQKVGKEQ